MQTYKFENIIQYRIKSDFYSDFLNIYSTKDNAANLLITQTPMGNYASLKIGDNVYSVYSEEENNRVFKIDFEFRNVDFIGINRYKNVVGIFYFLKVFNLNSV